MVERIRGLKLPRSLRARVALPFVALSVAILVFLIFFLGNAAEQTQLNNLQTNLHRQADIAAIALSRLGEGEDPAALLRQMAEVSDARITLVAADGTVLVDTKSDPAAMANHSNRAEIIEARTGPVGIDRRSSDTIGTEALYVAVPVPGSDDLVLRVSVPTTEISDAVSSTRRAIAISVVVSLLATMAASWFIAGRLAHPLQDLMRQAMRMAVGDFSVRVPPHDIREVENVGRAFNRMSTRLEEVIDRQEQTSLRLELVMSGLVDGVVLTDEQGFVLRMNPAAEGMLGIDEQEALGRPFVQAARDYEMARVLNKAFDGKDDSTATVEHGVDQQVIQVIARVVEGAHQRLGLVVLRDVTEVRRLESVRREFVANVSHELRTPLTSIRALVETLEAGAIDDPEMSMDFLGRIVGEIDRLNTLVEDLLDFARLEAGRTPLRLEYVDLGTVLANSARRLQQQIDRAGLAIEIDVADGLPEVAIDVGRIEQVLINLIHNAIKFTPAGGSLHLRARRERNTIYVSLRDTGIGISEDEQARLFERFYKSDKARRSEGTGLGLAIAQNIVRLHGGRISVVSTPGEGSEFTFTLPLKRKKAQKRARKHTLRGLV